jgi:hypothetical protein
MTGSRSGPSSTAAVAASPTEQALGDGGT